MPLHVRDQRRQIVVHTSLVSKSNQVHASIFARVKETVFVKDGAPIPPDEHPVMRELLKGPFPKGALVLSLALMPGTLTLSDCPCRREATCTFREGQIGINRSRQSHQ